MSQPAPAISAVASDDWWKDFHLPEMGDLLLERSNDNELQATLEFLCRELKLTDGAHVFDQCCGTGSLSEPMTRRGFQITGCDLFAPYVDRARERSADAAGAAHGATAEFLCADAFEFVPRVPCDAAFNWYSSFGYSATDNLNQKMLQCALESLKPGGRFALDVPNIPGLLRRFQPVMVQEGVSRNRSVCLTRSSTLDFVHGLLRQTWHWEIEGQSPIERQSAIRIYLPHQIAGMMSRTGFRDIRLLGDLTSLPFEMDSPRLIITAEKARP